MSKKFRPWTNEEAATAARIWRELGDAPKAVKYRAIGEAIGRSAGAVEGQWKSRGPSFVGVGLVSDPVISRGGPPAHVIEERNRAYAADVSTTAYWMGDPLPGRSALARRAGA